MATVAHEHLGARHPQRRAGRDRRGGARRRADRGPPAPALDLRQPRDARRRAGDGRVRAPAHARAVGQGDQRAVRRHPRRAARHRREGGSRRRQEAVMTVWWIGDIVLIVVVVPVVIYLLNGVLKEARGIVPSVRQIEAAAAAGSKDLDSAALLLTTQEQVRQTIETAANYGGSLDVILDDAT